MVGFLLAVSKVPLRTDTMRKLQEEVLKEKRKSKLNHYAD
jgi:hypothetical protein